MGFIYDLVRQAVYQTLDDNMDVVIAVDPEDQWAEDPALVQVRREDRARVNAAVHILQEFWAPDGGLRERLLNRDTVPRQLAIALIWFGEDQWHEWTALSSVERVRKVHEEAQLLTQFIADVQKALGSVADYIQGKTRQLLKAPEGTEVDMVDEERIQQLWLVIKQLCCDPPEVGDTVAQRVMSLYLLLDTELFGG